MVVALLSISCSVAVAGPCPDAVPGGPDLGRGYAVQELCWPAAAESQQINAALSDIIIVINVI